MNARAQSHRVPDSDGCRTRQPIGTTDYAQYSGTTVLAVAA